jgi:hypothetical protein
MDSMSEPGLQPNPEQVRSAAAAAAVNDPLTAELLARRSRGEKLTPQENGKLGGMFSKAKRLIGLGDASGQPTPAGTGNPARVDSSAPAETPGNLLPAVQPDDGLCKRTAKTVLERWETKDKRNVKAAAKFAKPSATAEELANYERSICLPSPDKTLLVELSPDVARELGIDPRHFAIGIFLGVLVDHRLEVWKAIDELKEIGRAREERDAKRVRAPFENRPHNDLPPVVPEGKPRTGEPQA